MGKYLKYVVLILLIISAAGYFVMVNQTPGRTFSIYIEGEIFKTINLDSVKDSYELSLPHNTLLIEHDGISVVKADCPDKICIERGKMSGGAPIVCAPAKLYIVTSLEGVDAVAW